MAKSLERCWWCLGHLEIQGGELKFRALPNNEFFNGQKVHVCCEPNALASAKLITAQPSQQGRYRE